MALNQRVLAGVFLRAIVPLLEDIAEIDGEVKKTVADWHFRLRFQLPGGMHASTLIFKDGGIEAYRGCYPGLSAVLTFKDEATLNAIFQGRLEQSPRPNLYGLLHLKKLLQVDTLLRRIEYYVKAEEPLIRDREFFSHCVRIALHALAYGVKEVGENDPEMIPLARTLPKGTLEIRVKDGHAVHIAVENGAFQPFKGPAEAPNAYLEFADLQTAWDMIQNKIDQFGAIGANKMKIRGLIPLIEGVNPILDRLSLYLNS